MATNKSVKGTAGGETTPKFVSAKPATSGKPRQVSSRCSNVSSSTNDGETAPVKKIPPIKAPVGLAKGPDVKNCKSKIGSLNNIKHTPASSGVTIQSQKLNWNAKSKVGSLENKEHKPGGGFLKVETRKLEWKAESKVQSLQNINHKPAGGKVKIFNETYMNKTATPKSAQKESNKTDANNNSSSERQAKQASETSIGPQQETSLAKDLKGLKI